MSNNVDALAVFEKERTRIAEITSRTRKVKGKAGSTKALKQPKRPSRRYDDVEFQFLAMDGVLTATGSVAIHDDGRMVIDIPVQSGSPDPCLVEGRLSNHIYVGHNILR